MSNMIQFIVEPIPMELKNIRKFLGETDEWKELSIRSVLTRYIEAHAEEEGPDPNQGLFNHAKMMLSFSEDAIEGIHVAEATIATLSTELERYKEWVQDLQSGMYVNCVYCGHRYGPADKVPASMADALKQHIEQCPEHPMSKLRAELEKFTPGGSEFHNDPNKCLDWIRDRLATVTRIAKERNELRSDLDAERQRVRELEKKGPIYCDAEHCKHAYFGTGTEDDPGFECDKWAELTDDGYTEFESDEKLPTCPMFCADFTTVDELNSLRGECCALSMDKDEAYYENAQLQAEAAAMRKVLEDWQQFGQLKPREENFIQINMANTKRVLESSNSGKDLMDEIDKLTEIRLHQEVDIAYLAAKTGAMRSALESVYPLIAGRVIQLQKAGEIMAMEEWNAECIKISQSLAPGTGKELLEEVRKLRETIEHYYGKHCANCRASNIITNPCADCEWVNVKVLIEAKEAANDQ